MKDTIIDANFPKTADGRVYHLGIKYGEVANRIVDWRVPYVREQVTVGSVSRAEGIAKHLDSSPTPFSLSSERGFLTITGRYRGVPLSIVCIGMGAPNVDFFIREVRECVRGDMLVIRLGSCGCVTHLPVGCLVLPKASVAITRNLDYDFINGDPWRTPYILSKPIPADFQLMTTLHQALQETRPAGAQSPIVTNVVNASTDSFYSSQGRQTAFQDHNAGLIDHLKATVPDIASMEMETYWIFHLATSWRAFARPSPAMNSTLDTGPVSLSNDLASSKTDFSGDTITSVQPTKESSQRSVIRAAAVQMVFASRQSQDFITPDRVSELERWSGRGVLEALWAMNVPNERLHPEEGSVWELREHHVSETG